jgi:cytochrome c-type biogenesis protein CcmF
MALGIAFSGPYKVESEIVLAEGETAVIDEYEIKYLSVFEDATPELKARATTTLEVSKGGIVLGLMRPDKRIYTNFERQQFAEVSTIFSLGDEVYATLLGFSEDNKASFKISVNPLVNWIWIGGTILCLMPLLVLRRAGRPGAAL